jgi:hypothetical protein
MSKAFNAVFQRLVQRAWWGDGFPPMVSAGAEVAVIEENLDQVEMVKASADVGRAGGGHVVHPSRPQTIGPTGCSCGGRR